MSTSTDAILVYGIPLRNEYSYSNSFNDVDDDFDVDDLPPGHPAALINGRTHDGLCAAIHCCDGCLMVIIAVEKSQTTASRGYPQRIEGLKDYKEHDEKLKEYCKKYKLETKGKPGWWLVSWWG
ncbi:MAG TPA: hypothetical protein VMX17_07880 [Candidatus Glassbacteria bacterium]|nr:hypothetical protein [Candidatus Glassbacteria bacterium]